MANLEIIKDDKNEMDVQVDSLTLVEILRVYLNQDSGVEFAAWKRAHPTESPVLKIKTKGKTAKKALKDAVDAVTKELDKFESDFKKLK